MIVPSLAGITLNKSLSLYGLNENPDVAYNVTQLLGGNTHVQIDSIVSSPLLELTATDGTMKQGWFCQSQIDQLKAIAAQAQPVALIHEEGTFQVLILEFDLDEWHVFEPPNPNKRFSGHILLQVV